MNLKEEWESRGLVYQFSDEKLFDAYNKGGEKFYIGFDPSADSLQIGNMFSVMAAIHLMKYGNKCYFLVGGATGMIGDPSLKDAERSFLSEEQLRHNEQSIYNQLKTFLNNIKKNYDIDFDYEMVNNYDFFKGMDYLKFLREVGKYMTINTMIAKESVKKRITDPDKSITYAEFSYMLIQGFDFLTLFDKYGVKMQLGGSDQRGNVTTGMELIRKKLDKEAFCMTIPLVTDASGAKYGKSAGNAVRVDRTKNSPYFVYQFFMNAEDELIGKLLKVFSLKSVEEIDEIVAKHNEKPELRYGQKELASRVVEVLFGKEAVIQAEKISKVLFGGENIMDTIKGFNESDLDALAVETGGINVKESGIGNLESGIKVLDMFTEVGLTSSNGDAKKMIQSASLFINEEKISNPQMIISKENFVNGILLLRKGKKQFKVVRLG
ncbi:tyrosine--tRNA ligase [Candidatus Gracilibacteria bacterium]|nr:tyrosine--tRNA ligase [Candidatus Gracilibacteria bacterium]